MSIVHVLCDENGREIEACPYCVALVADLKHLTREYTRLAQLLIQNGISIEEGEHGNTNDGSEGLGL